MHSRLFMRSALAVAVITLALPSIVFANDAKPATGFTFNLKSGDKATISVGGTQGCKFDVTPMTTNDKVCSVPDASLQLTSHKVVITAGDPGTAMVSLSTSNSGNQLCQGNTFQYTVIVSPNVAAAVKQAKAKMAAAQKAIQAAQKKALDDYKAAVAAILADLVSGGSPAEALSDYLDATQDALDQAKADTDEILKQLNADLQARLFLEYGLIALPMTLTGGGCGDWDKFASSVDGALHKALAAIWAAAKKAAMGVNGGSVKGGGPTILILVPFPLIIIGTIPPPPVKKTPPPPPPKEKPLSISWSGSGRLSTSPTGGLIAGGIANPDRGALAVTITAPDGSTTNSSPSIDGKGRWKVKQFGLTPGQYKVTVGQAGGQGPIERQIDVP